MTMQSLSQPPAPPNTREHREPRTYSERVEAARRDAAAEYREEIRALMRAGKL